MLKRLMAEPLVRRSMGSRRLNIAIGVALLIFAAGILFLLQIWNMGAFLLALGLLIFVLISVESLQSVMSAQNDMRRQNRRQMKLLTGSIKSSESPKRPDSQNSTPTKHRRIGNRASDSISMAEAAPISALDYGTVRDWTINNVVPGTAPLSVAAAIALWDDYADNPSSEVFHIGSVNSVRWLEMVINGAGRQPGNLTALIAGGLTEAVLGHLPPSESIENMIFIDSLQRDRPAGGSIGRLTAHMVDVVYIDMGVVESPETLKYGLPEYFIPWLRPETRIIVVNSSEIDIRNSVQKFLDNYPELLLKSMHAADGHAALVKA